MDLPDSNKSNLVSVPTDQLRQRLNRLYDTARSNPRTNHAWGRFDYLWDLKEIAMLEGRHAVDVPDRWLDELEKMTIESGDSSLRAH